MITLNVSLLTWIVIVIAIVLSVIFTTIEARHQKK